MLGNLKNHGNGREYRNGISFGGNTLAYINVGCAIDISQVLNGDISEKYLNKMRNYYLARGMGLVGSRMSDVTAIVLYNPGFEFISYINDLTGNNISSDNFIDINLVDKLLSSNIKSQTHGLGFISGGYAHKLFNSLSNKGVVYENKGLDKMILTANSKDYLRKVCGELMVDGFVVKSSDINYENDINNIYSEFISRGIGMYVRLSNGVSGFGNMLVNNNEKLKNLFEIIKGKNLTLILDKALPKDSIISNPSCLGAINNDCSVHAFSQTNQILNNRNEHQGNILIDEKEYKELVEKMRLITINIGKKYNSLLGIKGLYGIDFMLCDSEKLGDISLYGLNNNFLVNIKGKEYVLIVTEVNWRMTGAYPSAFVKNNFGLTSEYIGNLNTIKFDFPENPSQSDLIKFQNKLIRSMMNKNILFNPDGNKTKYGIYPFAMMPGQIQVVIVAKDAIMFDKLKVEVEEIIAGIKN